MILDKAKMAHDYAIEMLKRGDPERSIAFDAWTLADAMQAEADKRKPIPKLPALQQTFIDGVEQPRYAPSYEEWQPDWSQAPMGFNRFVVGSDGGYGFFTNMEPQLQDDFWFVGADGIVIKDHGYRGNWQDSLRKRPQ